MQPYISRLSRVGRARPIVAGDHRVLRRFAKPLIARDFRGPLLTQLGDDMLATVAHNNLVGMAAPQIAESVRLIVIDFIEDGVRFGPYVMANPVLEMSEGERLSHEGSPCLPGLQAEIIRAEHVICTGLDIDGKPMCLDATGMFAICIQHEIDHLDGILICDRAERLFDARDPQLKAWGASDRDSGSDGNGNGN